jgi:hypothetical protein
MKGKMITPLLTLALVLFLAPTSALAASPTDYVPQNLTAALITPDETHLYGSALLTFKVNGLPRSNDADFWNVQIEKKIGSNAWIGVDLISSDALLDFYQTSPGVFAFEQLWVEDYVWESNMPVSFRVKTVLFDNTWWPVGESGWSNIAAIGVQGSDWALPELEKAEEYGLIPDSLKGADLTKPITRAEFAAVTVKVYERLANTTAIPAVTNPFTDTKDAEVLKAYNASLVAGVAADKFAPAALLNREQAAVMLTRVFKRSTMPGWSLATESNYPLNYTKPAPFSDDAKISDWAKDSVYFMAANGVIGGTGNNNFSPRATTPAEEAMNHASATREQALAIAVRMVEKLQ